MLSGIVSSLGSLSRVTASLSDRNHEPKKSANDGPSVCAGLLVRMLGAPLKRKKDVASPCYVSCKIYLFVSFTFSSASVSIEFYVDYIHHVGNDQG